MVKENPEKMLTKYEAMVRAAEEKADIENGVLRK
jgi:hypothetical protein